MKKITIILVFLSCLQVQAQRIHAYVTSGAIGSQIEGDELKGFSHWSYTGGVGAIANLTENGTWALATEANYSCRGVFNNLANSSNPYNIDLNLHYVDIPLTLFFTDPYGGITLGAGLSYSRLVAQPHGKVRYLHVMPDSTDMDFLMNDLAAAIEVRFPIWNSLSFSGRYQYSIIPIKKDWHFTEGDETWSRNCYGYAVSFRLLWQFGDDDSRKYSHSKNKKKGRRR